MRQEGRTSNVTLGSIAMNELDCPRLVFITPYTPAEKRTIKTRVSDKLTKAVRAERLEGRLVRVRGWACRE